MVHDLHESLCAYPAISRCTREPHDRNYWVHITRRGGYKTLTDTKGFSLQDLYGWEIGEITDAAQVFRYSISTNMRCQPKRAIV